MGYLAGLLGRCAHANVRCIHGDEINHANGRRIRCLDCGWPLVGKMPEMCFYNKQAH